jgi:hypothetical protein
MYYIIIIKFFKDVHNAGLAFSLKGRQSLKSSVISSCIGLYIFVHVSDYCTPAFM